MSGKGLGAEGEENVMEDSKRQAAARRKRGEKGEESPVLENVFVPPPTNFGQKVPPKARNHDKADFATKVRKSSINCLKVNPEQ